MKQPGGRLAIRIACLLAGLFAGASVGLARDVSLVVESPAYAVGDTIVFVWTNHTDSTLIAVNLPPYKIFAFDSGKPVVGPVYATEFQLPPRTTARFTWDQRGSDLGEGRQQVPEGRYLVEISYYVVHENVWRLAGHLNDDFWIGNVSPVQPGS